MKKQHEALSFLLLYATETACATPPARNIQMKQTNRVPINQGTAARAAGKTPNEKIAKGEFGSTLKKRAG